MFALYMHDMKGIDLLPKFNCMTSETDKHWHINMYTAVSAFNNMFCSHDLYTNVNNYRIIYVCIFPCTQPNQKQFTIHLNAFVPFWHCLTMSSSRYRPMNNNYASLRLTKYCM